MDTKSRFNQDIFFRIWKTEFKEKGSGIDVYASNIRNCLKRRGIGDEGTRGGDAHRRCFGGGRRRGIGVLWRGRGCLVMLDVVSALRPTERRGRRCFDRVTS